MTEHILKQISDSIEAKTALLKNALLLNQIEICITNLTSAFKNNHKLLIAGNGGSAADAQHFATELSCRYLINRKALPAIALHTDSSALTAWSNDVAFESLFSRMTEAYGQKGDVLFLISTSGRSKNILNAAYTGKKMGLHTIALTGNDGGDIKNIADLTLICPGNQTPRIQEVHQLVYHMICEGVEQHFV